MVSLSFNEGFAKVVVARLLGSDPSVLSPDDVADGIGELVNMISGNAKTALSASSSVPYKLSLPTVIRGANHEICRQKTGSPFLMMEFEGEGERFYLQLTFKQYSFNY
jgi:chemotaxis protein CheX